MRCAFINVYETLKNFVIFYLSKCKKNITASSCFTPSVKGSFFLFGVFTMKLSDFSRREFIARSLKSAGVIVVSTGVTTQLTACDGSVFGQFLHGVASGDPLSDRVILWTRVSPVNNEDIFPVKKHHKQKKAEKFNDYAEGIWVEWEVAKDKRFRKVVIRDAAVTSPEHDYTLKVDAAGLKPNTKYYYRFKTANGKSAVGCTKTLPVGDVSSVKFAVVSCSNYPAGFFHVYGEVAKIPELDAVLHLGDYIYEYGREGYASEDAAALGREVEPPSEIISLSDYRTRYAQYRTDPQLQAAHAAAPFISVWDDHEITNDTWKDGAENHNEGEGPFAERLAAALQAYAEWMPIRPAVDENVAALQRSFQYGDLVNLSMLDTRIVARDQQLNLSDYFDATGQFDAAAYAAAVSDPNRSLIGDEQLAWLAGEFSKSAIWQVLGQQVLIGTMELPAAIVTLQLSLQEFAELATIAQIAATNPELLTPEQLQLLAEKGFLLQLGNLPYNLDAWDGYPVDRAKLLTAAAQHNSNLVVLAGDTHNAWANNIKLSDANVAVEFATSSVSSPGLEDFLGLADQTAILQTEAGLMQLIEGLQYNNISDRGYLAVEFTPDDVTANWVFVDTIKSAEYSVIDNRSKTITVAVGANKI